MNYFHGLYIGACSAKIARFLLFINFIRSFINPAAWFFQYPFSLLIHYTD